MISVFRKELKKWSAVLWVVFASMVLASFSMIVLRQPSPREIKIAQVNSTPIYLPEYQQALLTLNLQLQNLAHYARAQGISPEIFLAMAGLKNPQEAALKELINEKLLHSLYRNISLELDPSFIKEQIGKTLPPYLFDAHGLLNQNLYKKELLRMNFTIEEFEAKKENEAKQQIIMDCVRLSSYVPNAVIRDHQERLNVKKSFNVVTFPFEFFLDKSKKEKPDAELLRNFYEENKEAYRVLEKRKARYWVVPLENYSKKVSADEEAVELFYEKNKSSLFRIPPEVKLRKIVIKIENVDSPAIIMKAKLKAEDLYKQVTAHPENFEEIANKYPLNKDSAKGGIVPFFKKGTYDEAFEKAAFMLKEIGDIAPPLHYDDRFEIIQLLDKKHASYKPLTAVRAEIVKGLVERKATHLLKGDVEAALHACHEDTQALVAFAKQEKLKGIDSEWLTGQDGKGYSQKSLLAQKLFIAKKGGSNYGFFMHKDDYVIFHEVAREKSFVPEFKALVEKIEKEVIEKKAKEMHKNALREAMNEFFDKKAGLDELAGRYGGKVITTEFLKQGEAIASLKDSASLTYKAFMLTDPSQLLKYKNKNTYYLVTLRGTQKGGKGLSSEELSSFIEREREQAKMLNLNAFIASLTRHATIEKYENIAQYSTQVPEDSI